MKRIINANVEENVPCIASTAKWSDAFCLVRQLNSQKLLRVDYCNIVWIEAENNHSHLHLRSGDTITISTSLGAVAKALAEEYGACFIRVCRSEIINLHYLESIEGNILRLIGKNGLTIIGTSYREHFKQRVALAVLEF